MRKEAAFLRGLHSARARIKEVFEAPDPDIDRIIRSVRDGDGRISNKLQKELPLLAEPETASEVVRIVREAFSSGAP